MAEAAGLILAAIPLIISAIEHYRSNVGRVHNFLKWRGELENLVQALQKQRLIFSTNIFDLLKRAGADVDSSDRDTCAQILKSGQANSRIERYLEYRFELFESVVQDYERHLSKIAKHIKDIKRLPGSDADDLGAILAANHQGGSRFVFRQRLRFTCRRRVLCELIRELREENLNWNSVLPVNTGLSSNSAQIPEGDTSANTHRHLAFRNAANSLYKALSNSWTPGCHNSHGVLLHVEGTAKSDSSTKVSATSRASNLLDRLEFEVFVNLNGSGPLEKSKWSRAVVEALKTDTPDSMVSARASQCGVPTVSVIPEENPGVSSSDPQRAQVNDMCKAVKQARNKRKVLTLQVEQDSLHERRDRTAPSTSLDCHEALTLERFFARTVHNKDYQMGVLERMRLAQCLASSILQLQSTHWLTEPWTKSLICFFINSDRGPSIDPTRPVVSHVIPNVSGVSSRVKPHAKPTDALLELGILLQEIWNQESFESWVQQSPFGSTSHDRLFLACCWLEKAEKLYLPQYFAAIVAALKSFHHWADWDDDHQRQEVSDAIVNPLEELCNYVVKSSSRS